MAGALGDLVIALHADTAQFASDMGRAARISQQQWKRVADHAAAAARIIGFAAVAAGAAALKMGKDVLQSADDLSKLAQKVGVSTESLGELGYAADLSGVSIDSLGQALKKLSVNMLDTQANTGDARLAFQALNLSVESTKGILKTSEQVLFEVADKFATMEDGAGKTALAVKLFGRAGADLIPLLNQGARGLKENADEARRFGIVISTEAGKRAEEFNDNLTRLVTGIKGFGTAITFDALPALSRFLEQMLEGIRIAGGFGNAMRLFGLSTITIENAGEKINEFGKQLDELEKKKALFQRFSGSESFVASVDSEIADLRKRLEFAKFLQRQGAPKLAPGVRDEASRFPGQGKTKAPALPDEVAMRKAAAEAKRLADEFSKQQTFIANQWVEEMERQAQIMSEVAQLTDDYNRREREADKKTHDARMKAWFEFIDTQKLAEENAIRLANGFDEEGNKIKKELDEWGEFAKQAARNMQDSFSDFFFDVMQGKFSDLAGSFKATIDRMVANALAAKLAKALFGDFDKNGEFGGFVGDVISGTKSGGGGVSGFFGSIGSAFSKMLPSFDVGTDYVPQTGLALIHKGEAIIPASENVGGRGMTVNQSFNFAAPTDRRAQSEVATAAGLGVQRAIARNG